MRRDETHKPDLRIGPLQIWVSGRLPPDTENGWDEAFIQTYAIVEVPDAWVQIGRGNGLTSMAIAVFAAQLKSLDASLSGRAFLEGDWLQLELSGDGLGHCSGEMHLFRGYPRHDHRFSFDIDQTDVRTILVQSRRLLEQYPVPDYRGIQTQ